MIDLPQGDYIYKGTVIKQNRDTEAILAFLHDLGKTWIFVQGRGRNRFLGATEPMVWGEFCLYKNTHGLFLKSLNVKDDFLPLRHNANSLYLATRIYSLLADKLPFEIKNNRLLQSLYDTLTLINEGATGEATYLRFVAKFLSSYGLMPSFQICSNCGGLIHSVARLSEKGVFCDKCVCLNGLTLESNDLMDVRNSLCLKHDAFVTWCKSASPSIKLKNCSTILENYFEKMK